MKDYVRFIIRLSKTFSKHFVPSHPTRDRSPKSWGARCSRGRSLHRPTAAKAREREFFSRSKPTISRRLAAARSHYPHNLTFQLHRFKVRPEQRLVALARRRGTGSRRVRSRVSDAPALAIAFFVSVARRKVSSTNPPSRRPATDPRPPSDSIEPSADGFQGRFHFLLHLRVCQRGSPRQARGPGA